MITRLEISRLRGIEHGDLRDLTPLVVLVGPNGAGKSTVLDALLLGAAPNPATAVGLVVKRRLGVRRGARWLYWQLAEQGGVELKTEANGVRRTRTFEPPSTETQHLLQAVVKDETDDSTSGQRVHFRENNDYEAPSLSVPIDGVAHVRLVEPAGRPSTPLHQLYTSVVEQGRRRNARKLLESVVPELDDIEILTEGDEPVLHLVFEDRSIPVGLAGDGIQALVHLSLELASRRDGAVVLAEEPEVHMHPGAIRQCAHAIVAAVRRNVQVVVSTHSLELIDALVGALETDTELGWLSVHRLRLDHDGALHVARVPGLEVAEARSGIADDLR